MEPINYDKIDRLEALTLAVQLLQGRDHYSTTRTIEVAEAFLKWLNKEEEASDN